MTATLDYRSPWSTGLPQFGEPSPKWVWTLIGASSIPLWATWPTLAVSASAIPAFELLTIAFAVAWCILSQLDRSAQPREAISWQQAGAIVACSLGLIGTNAFFILATAHIPAAQANLISYLWPVMIVAFGAMLGLFTVTRRHLMGILVGFIGVAVVVGADDVVFSWRGIILAGFSGASWALFCLFRLWQGTTAKNVLAQGCLISAILSLGLHLTLEETVFPAIDALTAAAAVGVAPLALANLAWDNGIRRGDGRTLAIMAFATPLAGALVLVGAGYAVLTANLLIGGLLIVAAGLLSTAPSSTRHR